MSEHNPKYVEALKCGKLDYSVVPWPALRGLALAMQEGAHKYGRFNYRQDKIEARTYIAAILRHLFGDPSTGSDGWINGEDSDVESGLHHLTKVMACCALVLDAEDHGMLIDNRLETESKEPPSLRDAEYGIPVDAQYDMDVEAPFHMQQEVEDDGFITNPADLSEPDFKVPEALKNKAARSDIHRILELAARADAEARHSVREAALTVGGPGWYVEFADEESNIGETFITVKGPFDTESEARIYAHENPERFAGRRVIFNHV